MYENFLYSLELPPDNNICVDRGAHYIFEVNLPVLTCEKIEVCTRNEFINASEYTLENIKNIRERHAKSTDIFDAFI